MLVAESGFLPQSLVWKGRKKIQWRHLTNPASAKGLRSILARISRVDSVCNVDIWEKNGILLLWSFSQNP